MRAGNAEQSIGGEQVSQKTERPNILLVVADDWSHPHASCHGCGWVRTPAFDRVAREGLLFANAYTPNAKCAPSRASILTGRNPWQLKAACNHNAYFPLEFITYPEALGAHGYFVGFTAKGWAPGVALDADGGERRLTGTPFNARTSPPPTTGIDSNDYAANFGDFLDAAPEAQPWCFWFGCREPHRDYEYGSGVRVGGKSPDEIDRVPAYWPDVEVVRNDMLDYSVEVEHLDRHLGRMLEELERRGQLENTLVVVTSDNGMPFPRRKGNLYEGANHIPLAAMWKCGIKAPGRVVDDYVSLVDLAPTFIEAAGLHWEETGMAPAVGASLSDLFSAGKPHASRSRILLGQERHDVGRPRDEGYPIRSFIKDGWLYSRNFEPDRWPSCNPETGYMNTDGSPTKSVILEARRKDPGDRHWALCFGRHPAEELFHLEEDPDCLNNLAVSPEHQARKDEMHRELVEELKRQGDPRMFGQGDIFEAEPYAGESRNFYERFLRGETPDSGWVNPTDFEPEPLE